MALIVYLDTQDYINVFNEPQDGPSHNILAEILAFRDRGEVIIGFSFATIMEFITKPDAANRAERVRRGQLVKDICGAHAFPYLTDIPKGATFPNGGRWMLRESEKIVSGATFRRMLHRTLTEGLQRTEGLNRNQRRQLARKASMHELVRKMGGTWGRKRSDWGDFPVSNELLESRIFERFAKGECSDREFEDRLTAWLSDPAEYSRIIYDYADEPNVIEKYFGKHTDKIEESIQAVQNGVDSFRNLNSTRLETRAELIGLGMPNSEARKATKQLPIPEPDDSFDQKLASVLGEGRIGHFRHYIQRVLKGEGLDLPRRSHGNVIHLPNGDGGAADDEAGWVFRC